MTAWWNGNAVPWDLETDGKDPLDARIITSYVGEVRDNRAAPGTAWLVQPERDIDPEATKVHGITTEDARAGGMDRAEAVEQIATALARGAADPKTLAWGAVPVVGHNLAYDLTLLDREMRRLSIGRLADSYGGDPRVTVILRGEPVGAFYVIDSMVLDKAIDTYRPGPKDPVTGEKLGGRNTLERVAEFYGVPIRGDAHSADADAMAAARIAWAIAKRCAMADGNDAGGYDMRLQSAFLRLYADRRHPEEIARVFANVSRMTLPELHAWQKRMAREQAASFRQYCIDNPVYVEEKGIDIAGIDGSWPIRPLTDSSKTETVAAVSGDIL